MKKPDERLCFHLCRILENAKELIVIARDQSLPHKAVERWVKGKALRVSGMDYKEVEGNSLEWIC